MNEKFKTVENGWKTCESELRKHDIFQDKVLVNFFLSHLNLTSANIFGHLEVVFSATFAFSVNGDLQCKAKSAILEIMSLQIKKLKKTKLLPNQISCRNINMWAGNVWGLISSHRVSPSPNGDDNSSADHLTNMLASVIQWSCNYWTSAIKVVSRDENLASMADLLVLILIAMVVIFNQFSW